MGPWYSGNTDPWHGSVRGSTPLGSTQRNIGAKIAVLFLAVFLALVYLSQMKNSKLPEKKFLVIGVPSVELKAELADTAEKRTLGLSGREKLGANEAMLFVFADSSIRQFWMKDIKFALDVIWIDENKKIVDITKNALPDSYPRTFSPLLPAKYVLELNAGFTDENKIEIGDRVIF